MGGIALNPRRVMQPFSVVRQSGAELRAQNNSWGGIGLWGTTGIVVFDSDLLPNTPGTDVLGNSTFYWGNAYFNKAARANCVDGNAINKTLSAVSTQSVSAGASWTPAAGVYNMAAGAVGSGSAVPQLWDSATWQGGAATISGLIVCDGANVRLYGVSTTNVYYATI